MNDASILVSTPVEDPIIAMLKAERDHALAELRALREQVIPIKARIERLRAALKKLESPPQFRMQRIGEFSLTAAVKNILVREKREPTTAEIRGFLEEDGATHDQTRFTSQVLTGLLKRGKVGRRPDSNRWFLVREA